MLKAKKKNRVLRISDEKYEEYKAMGYTIADETGKVVYTPPDTSKRIAELEAENTALRAELETLKGNSSGQEENAASGEENAVATDAMSRSNRHRGK